MPLAKFAANNAESEALSCSPFFTNYRYNPYLSFEPQPVLAHSTPPAQINAEEFASVIEDNLDYLREEIAAAQAKYEDNANRIEILHPHCISVIKCGWMPAIFELSNLLTNSTEKTWVSSQLKGF